MLVWLRMCAQCIRYHMQIIESTQWSFSVLFWLCHNWFPIKTSFVTNCETFCIFLWSLLFIPSNQSILYDLLIVFHKHLIRSDEIFIQLNFDEYPCWARMMYYMENILLVRICSPVFKVGPKMYSTAMSKDKKNKCLKKKKNKQNLNHRKKRRMKKGRCVMGEREKYLFIHKATNSNW